MTDGGFLRMVMSGIYFSIAATRDQTDIFKLQCPGF